MKKSNKLFEKNIFLLIILGKLSIWILDFDKYFYYFYLKKMQIERKDLPNSKVELTVTETVENVQKHRKSVLEDIRKNAEIKGFRKGANIPEPVLVKEFGEERINAMVIEKAIDKMYVGALKQEKIMPVAQGEITEIVSESPLTIKMQVEVFPKVELKPSYKDIKLKKKAVKVEDKEVKAALWDIETRFTTFKEVEDKRSKTKMGDRITVDTQWFDLEGKKLENTDMKNYPLVLGSNILVPGFEEQLVGAKLGDELSIDVTFPADYHNADFAGKETKFTVNINKFERAEKPEFTEGFIEKLRGKKLDLDGFKALIKEEIKETKEANTRMEEEAELIDELLKHTEFELGEKMLAEQTNRMFEEIKQNMAQQGIKMSDYLESLKLSEEQYKKDHIEENARKRLSGELILTKIVEEQKTEVEDEVVSAEIKKIMSNYQNEEVLKRLEELYQPGTKYYEELRQRMKYRKVIDGFFA